jgi:hypothetical protein
MSAARQFARLAVLDYEAARIKAAVEATVQFAAVCRALGVTTLAEARAELDRRGAELERRLARPKPGREV